MNYSKKSLMITRWIFGYANLYSRTGWVSTASPALWSFANRMMTYLLDLAGRPKGRGARPHILKVAKIPP